MGFYFAKPTTFKQPMFSVDDVDYYEVDHTPGYLWECATRSISAVLIVHLPVVIAGRNEWKNNTTIQKVINVDQGVVQKDEILEFENREPEYPHATRMTTTSGLDILKA